MGNAALRTEDVIPLHPTGQSRRVDIETAAKRFASIIKRTAPRHGLSHAECERAIRTFRDRLLSAPVSADTGDTLALPLQREAMAAALDLVHRHRELPVPIIPLRHDREVPLRRVQLADRAPVSGALARALDTLPDTTRGVVRMYLAGYAQHEIGDLLGWTNGELRATLHRGFAELRDAMSGMGCAPEAWE
jgi:DNA-directed RNA polymerase specialized sigma24 family protein